MIQMLLLSLLLPPQLDETDRYGGAPRSMEDPYLKVVEVPYEVNVPETKVVWEKCIERYGFRGRRCRIVYRKRTIQIMRSETRTRSETVAVAALRGQTGAKESEPVDIELEAPRTAGAIAALLARTLDDVFPAQSTPYRDMIRLINPDAVDFRSDTPIPNFDAQSGTVDLQVRIDIDPLNRRKIRLVVAARDGLNGGNSQDEANKRAQQIAPLLTREP